MIRPRLAICDGDAVYCHRLDEYLHGNLKLSFEIFSFTDISILMDFCRNEEVSLLIISERMFGNLEKDMRSTLSKNVLVLDEGIGARDQNGEDSCDDTKIEHISKYQEASRIVDGIINLCASSPEDFKAVAAGTEASNANVIGFYTPISRCGQTTFARAMAKKFAEKGKTIFLSFESFSSLPHLLGIQKGEDITDIMYYTECERDKLGIFLEKVKCSKEGVDYIMPARTAAQLRDISFDKLCNLVEILTKEAGYEYVVMDLTDYPDGFLDICLLCRRIFTVVRDNPWDAYRQKVFEEVLIGSGYEEIKSKMTKVKLPDIRDKKVFNAFVNQILSGDSL